MTNLTAVLTTTYRLLAADLSPVLITATAGCFTIAAKVVLTFFFQFVSFV